MDLPEHVADMLRVKAAQAYPREACGVIYKDHRVHEYQNTSPEPEHGFDMEIDITNDVDIIWHSHCNGLEWPSRQDAPRMVELAHQGFDFRWLIVTSSGGLHMYKVVASDSASAAA